MKAATLGLGLSLLAGTAMAQSAPAVPPPAASPAMPSTGAPGGGATPPPGQMPQAGAPHGVEPYQDEMAEQPYGYGAPPPPGYDEGGGPDEPDGPQGMRAWPQPHPHGRMHSPEGKAAHFRMKSGDTGLDIKCPEDEPVKACVDALLPLLDRIAPQHH